MGIFKRGRFIGRLWVLVRVDEKKPAAAGTLRYTIVGALDVGTPLAAASRTEFWHLIGESHRMRAEEQAFAE
jgi:hypothetical protein